MKSLLSICKEGDYWEKRGVRIKKNFFEKSLVDDFILTFYCRLMVQAYKLNLIDEVTFPRKCLNAEESVL